MKRKFIWTLFVTIFVFVLHNNVYAQLEKPFPKVEIPGTQELTFTSSLVAQEYKLYIHLPANYAQDTGKIYPVLYLLDGQWDFALLTGIYGAQYYDGFLPGLIIVGITWGGKDPDISMLRERDFTPTRMADKPQSGGGPKFLEFIKTELIPFISSRYRVTDDRTLIGSSLGGLFTLYTLFNDPALFRRYMLTSPTLSWDNSILRSFEKKYEERKSSIPARLFIGKGGLETDVAEFQEFAQRLKEKKVKGLELHSLLMKNTGHSGSAPEGFSRGLQSVFEKPSLQLAPAILNKYTGAYLVGTDTVFLSKQNGKLIATIPFEHTKYDLQAATEKDFYVNGVFINVHFKMDDAGKVSGFDLVQFEGGVFIKKLIDQW